MGNWETKENASNFHKKVLKVIRELFPHQLILQEHPIKISQRKTLYADIYLPKLSLIIEVDGRQHQEVVPHFHESKWAFRKQQVNDEEKEIWCEANGIILIRFSHLEEEKISKEYVQLKVKNRFKELL